jgi:WD40 repeat protein
MLGLRNPTIVPIILQGNTDTVSSLSFSSDGSVLAAGSMDHIVEIWDVHNRARMATIPTRRTIPQVVFHPLQNDLLAIASDNDAWYLYQLENLRAAPTLLARNGDSHAGQFSPSGKYFAIGGDSGQVKVVEIKSGSEVTTLSGHLAAVSALAFLKDNILASGAYDKTARIWEVDKHREIVTLSGHRGAVRVVNCVNEFSLISAGIGKKEDPFIGEFRLWKCPTGDCVFSGALHCDGFLSGVVSQRDRCLILGSSDGTIAIYRLNPPMLVRHFSAHQRMVYALAISPDGNLLASGGIDDRLPGAIKLWDVSALLHE